MIPQLEEALQALGSPSPAAGWALRRQRFSGCSVVVLHLELPLFTHLSRCSAADLPPHLRLQQHHLQGPLDSPAAGRRGLAAPACSSHPLPLPWGSARWIRALAAQSPPAGWELKHQKRPGSALDPAWTPAGPPWQQCPTALSPPQAVDRHGLDLPGSVSAIMDRWILQMGFPVVTVDTRTGTAAQSHFLLDRGSAVERPSAFK